MRTTLAANLGPTLDRIDATASGTLPAGVIPTGLTVLDEMLSGGLQPGHLYVITGVPGVGTSTLALDMARSAALRQGLDTLVLSAALPTRDVTMRVLAAEAGVVVLNMRNGQMTEKDRSRLAARTTDVDTHADRLVIDDTVPARFDDLDAMLSTGADPDRPWRLLVLDNASLLTRRVAPEHRWAAASEVALELKRTARRLNIPVVATAPPSRAVLNRLPQRTPRQGDWGTSAEFESEADTVIAVHRPDYFDLDSVRYGEADLIGLKHRFGATFTVTVVFQGRYCRFANMP